MLKEAPIRSEKYRRGANSSPCRFRGPTCNADPQTSQFAHANGAAFGKGAMIKAHDIAGIDACSDCHHYIDVGHGTKPLISDAEFWWLMCRALVETMVDRIRRGIVIVPLDAERLPHDKPTPPRKSKDQRAPIQSRNEWPKGRKITSANTLKRKERA